MEINLSGCLSNIVMWGTFMLRVWTCMIAVSLDNYLYIGSNLRLGFSKKNIITELLGNL